MSMKFRRSELCNYILLSSFTLPVQLACSEARFLVRMQKVPGSKLVSNSVECFHRTVKPLLRALCLEAGEEWEKNLDSALLALRTVTHESIGFSPSELVFGKNLRTPQTLLYEKYFEPEEDEIPVTEYVFQLINRLKLCQEVAVKQMEELQIKRKKWYDKNAVKREFKEG
ncbi:hypothetical protein AVEN_94359-1 [Araneus ventricosus]|uniref:Integrase catalytic domain-containing protein n=1 Tax=Araneus ventricosus TaxID=182803 RepID=A0A4Y2EDI7_ARAVE|nr:hypothetical protein AVEN_94359-1 [Araneus ventricosus]